MGRVGRSKRQNPYEMQQIFGKFCCTLAYLRVESEIYWMQGMTEKVLCVPNLILSRDT